MESIENKYKQLQESGANSTIWKNNSTHSIGILVETSEDGIFYSQETGYKEQSSGDLLDSNWILLGNFIKET